VGIHDCEQPVKQCIRFWTCERNAEVDNIFLSQEKSTQS
jgi:hypothetical protein